jgi:outer membrane murein-binding lipoprotein Lpp
MRRANSLGVLRMKLEANNMMNAGKVLLISTVVSFSVLTAGCSKADKTSEDTAAIRALLEKQEAEKKESEKKSKEYWEKMKKETGTRIPY